MKKFYCIRHGKALHNVLYPLIGNVAYTDKAYIDTPLVDEGIYQAEKLALSWKEKNKIDIVYVSPLTRTLETALHIFKNTDVKIVANEEIIEYSQGEEYCNFRKKKSELIEKYPRVDFSLLEESPKYWNNNRLETFEELKQRDQIFKNILKEDTNKKICIVSHNTYLKQFLFGFVDSLDEKQELQHCFPYERTFDENKINQNI